MSNFSAAQTTLHRADPLWQGLVKDTSFSRDHLWWMTTEIGRFEGEAVPDEGKIGRWLGWLQAACVVQTGGKLSMDDCRNINRRAFLTE